MERTDLSVGEQAFRSIRKEDPPGIDDEE